MHYSVGTQENCTSSQHMTHLPEIWKAIREQYTAVLALAQDNQPYACTIFYVTDGKALYFKSQNDAKHSQIIKENNKAAVSLFEDQPTYAEKKGVQLLGVITRVNTADEIIAIKNLFASHPTLAAAASKIKDPAEFLGDTAAGFYAFIPAQAKIVDTTAGKHVYSAWEDVTNDN